MPNRLETGQGSAGLRPPLKLRTSKATTNYYSVLMTAENYDRYQLTARKPFTARVRSSPSQWTFAVSRLNTN